MTPDDTPKHDGEDGPSLRDFMPGAATADGDTLIAKVGTPLPAGQAVAGEAAVIEALKSVHDPEIPVNIYDLGLIYEVKIADDGNVSIRMTLTAPACPVAGEMPGLVGQAVAALDGIGEVTVALVWDPPWTKDRMSEDARFALDMW